MKLVLDTRIPLSLLAGDPSLPIDARDLVSTPENTVFVSAASLWEIWLKQSLGKQRLPSDFEDRLARESFESLPLTAAHLELLTADEQARAYGAMVLVVR